MFYCCLQSGIFFILSLFYMDFDVDVVVTEFTLLKGNRNLLDFITSKRFKSQASQLPRINTKRFKNIYFDWIRFKYNLAI